MTAREPVVRVLVEAAPKKAFAVALDWPGWARPGRDEAEAVAALSAYVPRYAPVVAASGLPFPGAPRLEVVERLEGTATTAFGAPARVASADADPLGADEAARLARVLEACWHTLDAVVAAAPAVLRKGPRGGGRDTAAIAAHVDEADAAYLTKLGLRRRDLAERAARRSAVLGVVRSGTSGGAWPVRYAARRFAWHALDHAWEIEDRSR